MDRRKLARNCTLGHHGGSVCGSGPIDGLQNAEWMTKAVLDGSELDEKMAEIVARLRAALSPVRIYLYGSYAYGTPEPGSDIDLLVLLEDSPLDPYERDATAYLALSSVDVPIDVQVYTVAEFEERAALPVSFERTVKRKGKLVHAV